MERGLHVVLICLSLVSMAMVSACAHTPPISESTIEQDSAQAEQARVSNEYLVTLAPDANENVISEYYGRFGIKYMRILEEETYLLILTKDPGPEQMENMIQNEPRIKVVQPNLIQWDYR